MNILIVYATIEGHSHKIAEWIADRVRTNGNNGGVIDASILQGTIDVAGHDAIFIIAPVRQRAHPEAVLDFIFAHRDSLHANPSALISVSLSAAFDASQAEPRSYVDHMLQYVGWQPAATDLAAGALHHDEYDYFKEQIIRHVVLRGRGAASVMGHHDFTTGKRLDALSMTSSRQQKVNGAMFGCMPCECGRVDSTRPPNVPIDAKGCRRHSSRGAITL